ncbi:hypothetical protein DC498_01115 [Terrimonas sp.]|nr:hypothetical protein DC498_01115 [Terrimonas sp.]
MASKYYFFYLEIALRNPKYKYIYAFENVSHIPIQKFIEIFKIDIKKDPRLLDGYFLTRTAYNKHKKYLDQNLPSLEFDIFEYCLRQYSSNDISSVRKLYKKSLME